MKRQPMTLDEKILSSLLMILATMAGLAIIAVAVFFNFVGGALSDLSEARQEANEKYSASQSPTQ